MATDELDMHRDTLRALGKEKARFSTFKERRTAAVAAARRAGMTWREASILTGVTEAALRAADGGESFSTRSKPTS